MLERVKFWEWQSKVFGLLTFIPISNDVIVTVKILLGITKQFKFEPPSKEVDKKHYPRRS